jgi:inner membrane protein
LASVLSHPAVVAGFAPLVFRARVPTRALALGAACSLLPDLDVIGFRYGIPYGHPFGHRGITHSLTFAAVVALALTLLGFREERRGGRRLAVGLFLFLCGASHGFFDAMTDGGLGVAFFAPFDNRRHFLPFRPIAVSPIGIGGFFGPRGAAILETELVWVWLPCLALGAAGILVRRRLRLH